MDSFHSFSSPLPNLPSEILDFEINPQVEELFRIGFNIYTVYSNKYFENANSTDLKICGILIEEFLNYEKISNRAYFHSRLASPSKSPEQPQRQPSQLKSQHEVSNFNASRTEVYFQSLVQGEEEIKSSPKYSSGSEKNSINSSPSNQEVDLEEIMSSIFNNCLNGFYFESFFQDEEKTNPKDLMDSKSKQNEMKNHQGAIAGKVKNFCKKDKKTGINSRLFNEATVEFSPIEKEDFREWALSYEREDRTWKKLKEFVGSHSKFGFLFVDMTIQLLSEAFKNEYDECINKGQMENETKSFLKEQSNKDFYIEKFKTLQGEDKEFKKNITKQRKSL